MEHTPQQALIPVKQAIALFHGYEVLLVRLPDDRVAAILNSLCIMLGIERKSQARRIRRHKVLAQYLLLALVETAGGPQYMDVLIVEAIHDWLLGIQVEQLALEKRPLVLALQTEAVAFFYRHFFDERAIKPQPEPEPAASSQLERGRSELVFDAPKERLFEALRKMQEALQATQEALYDFWKKEQQTNNEQLARDQRALTGRMAVFEEWLTSLDRRVAGTGQGSPAALGWLPMLSPAHLADLQMLLRSLEQATGRTQAQLEQELVETFRVSAINAIPDELWQDVLDWWTWRAQQAK